MPSRIATSSFEHPAAIRATTSRCRSVIAGSVLVRASYMAATLLRPRPGRHWSKGVSCRLRSARYRFASDEARLVAAGVRLAQLVLVERADPQQELDLVAEVRTHHLGPVGGDRERDAVVRERAERVAHRVLVRERLGEQVRGRADLEHDAGVAQPRHQLGVARGEDAVPDPIRMERLDDLCDLLEPVLAALLADVDGHAEPRGACLVEQWGELAVRVAPTVRAWPGDVDADDAARRPRD